MLQKFVLAFGPRGPSGPAGPSGPGESENAEAVSGMRPPASTLPVSADMFAKTTSMKRDEPDGNRAGFSPSFIPAPKKKLILPLTSTLTPGCSSANKTSPCASCSWTDSDCVLFGGKLVGRFVKGIV